MNLPVKPIDSWSRGICDCLGNSVSMNLPVKPIDSWSRGIHRCLGNSVSMNLPVKPIDSWSRGIRSPRKQRQHESSSKANRQLVKRNSPLLGNSVSMNLPHLFTGIEEDYLGNSVSMNLPVKPIDSWSRGIRRRLLAEPTFESLHPTLLLVMEAQQTRTRTTHRAERLDCDLHACRYPAFPSRLVSLTKPMLPEQPVDAYLLSHAASQVDSWYIWSTTSNFRDGLLICLPSSLTARPPELYWFFRNGHHLVTTFSLYCRKPLPTTFFIVIPFPSISARSLIQVSSLCWSCSIHVLPEYA
ncbi:unnamed protein product [Protopolystoma xenopodis]|uniref:Uncharacterized protein n=1 Tax=Protopolystoma xenopodis TaxID=117903 RepID=A0A3S5C5Z8_9PLAT|nr:unnamed protein product [Protopolystoma xenopodis]